MTPNYEGVNVMQVKFSEDVIPLSDLKINPGKVVSRAQDTHRPILLTSRGRGIAVVQGLEDYEKTAEELQFVKAAPSNEHVVVVAKGAPAPAEAVHVKVA